MTRGDAQVDAEEAAERLKAVHWDRVKRKGSLAEASRRLGEDVGYLAGQKEHARGLRVQDALQSLELLGSPMPEEVLHEAFFSEPKDPAEILLYSKEHRHLRRDPLLVRLAPRIENLAALGPTANATWECEWSRLREIDRLRRRDREEAYRRLRQLLVGAMNRLTGSSRPLEAFVELSCALGMLAAILRFAGKRDDAVDILVLARSLVKWTKNPRSEAEWYQKAAFLLVDLGRLARAEEFILQAHKFFDLCGSATDRVGSLVDLAYVYTHSERYEDSRNLLDHVLTQLESQDVESRIAAHQVNSKNFQALGDLRRACTHLVAAMDLVGDDLLARASCLWRLAKLLTALDDLPQALAMYREAMPLYAKLAEASDLAELAMEYARLLLLQDKRIELNSLATDLTGWIGRLKARSRLRHTILDFKALTEMGNLDPKNFAAILRQIQEAKKMDGRRRCPRNSDRQTNP